MKNYQLSAEKKLFPAFAATRKKKDPDLFFNTKAPKKKLLLMGEHHFWLEISAIQEGNCGWRLLCFHNLYIAGVLLPLSPLSHGLVSDIRVLRGFQKPGKLILVQHRHYDTPFWNRPVKCIDFKNVGNDLFHSHYPSAGNQIQCQIKFCYTVHIEFYGFYARQLSFNDAFCSTTHESVNSFVFFQSWFQFWLCLVFLLFTLKKKTSSLLLCLKVCKSHRFC